MQAWKNLEQGHYVLAGLAILLFVLAVVLVREATLAIRRNKQGEISLSDTVSVLGDPPPLMKRRLPSEGE